MRDQYVCITDRTPAAKGHSAGNPSALASVAPHDQTMTTRARVLVEGRLRTRTWKDKDGIERRTTEIVARRVQFLGGATKAA